MWALFAFAIVLVLGTLVYGMATLNPPAKKEFPPFIPPTWPSTAPAPSSAPSPPETTAPQQVLPPAIPHAPEGLFLSPAYADGGKAVKVKGRKYVEMVGASKDGSIVAVNVDYELRGIEAATSKVVWTYPTYSCSLGSWDGVVLCADSDDLETASNGGPVPDIVRIDLSDGRVLSRITPANVPWNMDFIGADDTHGYFRVSFLGVDGYEAYGRHHVLAFDSDGSLAWMTPLETDESVPLYQAALVSGNQISLHLERSVVVLDRASGAVTTDAEVDDTFVRLGWDGWSHYDDDDRLHRVFDLEGNPVGTYPSLREFIPGTDPSQVLAVAVHARDDVTVQGEGHELDWGVTREGERVVGGEGFSIIDTAGDLLVRGARLHGISADGALFMSDLDSGTIHDSSDGATLASFPSTNALTELEVLDGIAFRTPYPPDGKLVVLLPGA